MSNGLQNLALALLLFTASSATQAHQPNAKELQQFSARQNWLQQQGVAGAEAQTTPRHINALIHAQSPYLLTHALQPVHWREWSPVLFSESGERLVFISIGYATCHWCHVMAGESFADVEVAEVLDADFTTIKVDREQLPAVDAIYRQALERLQGEAGWPINLVTTPAGDILWIDSYQSKTQLLARLRQLGAAWRQNPQRIISAGKRFSQLLQPPPSTRSTLPTPAASRDLLFSAAQQLHRALSRERDSSAPVFPRAHWLQLLLLAARADSNPDWLAAVEERVGRIMQSPTWDPVDGGLHRYSETSDWHSPHFEKMLYDQAQWLSLQVSLYQQTGKVEYLRTARQTQLWVSRFLAVGPVYGSALSAFSTQGEGDYYFSSPAQVPATIAPGQVHAYFGDEQRLLLRGPLLDSQRTELRALRLQQQAPHRDEKVIVGWNAMYLLALLDLYGVTGDQDLLESVSTSAEFIWSTAWQAHSSQLQRVIFQGQASTPAAGEDYAWLGQLCATLARLSNSERWLQRAQLLSRQPMMQQLADNTLSLDQEMAAPLRALLTARGQLARASGDKQWRTMELDAFAAQADLGNRVGALIGLHDFHQLGPQTGASWFANGHGWVSGHYDRASGQVNLQFNLQSPWHINANPAGEGLLATDIEVDGASAEVVFPAPELVQTPFADAPLPLYSGEFTIPLAVTSPEPTGQPLLPLLRLHLQACSDSICLLPEQISLYPVTGQHPLP